MDFPGDSFLDLDSVIYLAVNETIASRFLSKVS